MSFDNRPFLKLHFIVVLWGFTAVLGLLISLSFVEVVFYRTLLAFIGLALLMKIIGVGFYVHPRQLVKLLLTGFMISIHWLLFFGAGRVANASVSLIGLATVSLWTSLIEPLTFRKRISFIEVFFGIAVMGGLYIIYRSDFEYGLGLLMSLGAALLAALFSVFNVGFVKRIDPIAITFYEMVGAFLATIPFLFLMSPDQGPVMMVPGLMDFIYLLILALVCTVYANSESIRLLRRLSAFSSNLVINMEPVYGIILALLFFGKSEHMHLSFYLGSSLVIAAVLIFPIISRKFT